MQSWPPSHLSFISSEHVSIQGTHIYFATLHIGVGLSQSLLFKHCTHYLLRQNGFD